MAHMGLNQLLRRGTRSLQSTAQCMATVPLARTKDSPDIIDVMDLTEGELSSDNILMDLYNRWCIQHGLVYDPETKKLRFGTFKSNVHLIHNTNSAGLPYTLQLNRFGDTSASEFACLYPASRVLAPGPGHASGHYRGGTPFIYDAYDVPEERDWVKMGAVIAVKNQGRSRTCWAIAAAGATEGIYAIKTGRLVSLSAQQLIDCDTKINCGVQGGFEYEAFKYIADSGICEESLYPYSGAQGFLIWPIRILNLPILLPVRAYAISHNQSRVT